MIETIAQRKAFQMEINKIVLDANMITRFLANDCNALLALTLTSKAIRSEAQPMLNALKDTCVLQKRYGKDFDYSNMDITPQHMVNIMTLLDRIEYRKNNKRYEQEIADAMRYAVSFSCRNSQSFLATCIFLWSTLRPYYQNFNAVCMIDAISIQHFVKAHQMGITTLQASYTYRILANNLKYKCEQRSSRVASVLREPFLEITKCAI